MALDRIPADIRAAGGVSRMSDPKMIKGIQDAVSMTFIRAPYIESVKPGVEVLAVEKEHIVAVRYQNQLAMSFHPELDEDERIHRYFMEIVRKSVES